MRPNVFESCNGTTSTKITHCILMLSCFESCVRRWCDVTCCLLVVGQGKRSGWVFPCVQKLGWTKKSFRSKGHSWVCNISATAANLSAVLPISMAKTHDVKCLSGTGDREANSTPVAWTNPVSNTHEVFWLLYTRLDLYKVGEIYLLPPPSNQHIITLIYITSFTNRKSRSRTNPHDCIPLS